MNEPVVVGRALFHQTCLLHSQTIIRNGDTSNYDVDPTNAAVVVDGRPSPNGSVDIIIRTNTWIANQVITFKSELSICGGCSAGIGNGIIVNKSNIPECNEIGTRHCQRLYILCKRDIVTLIRRFRQQFCLPAVSGWSMLNFEWVSHIPPSLVSSSYVNLNLNYTTAQLPPCWQYSSRYFMIMPRQILFLMRIRGSSWSLQTAIRSISLNLDN